MKTSDWLILGGAAALAWLLVSATSKVINAAGALFTSTGEAIGSGLFDLFNPADKYGQTSLMVVFPDGSRHAVDAGLVSAAGYFTVPLPSDLTATYAPVTAKVAQQFGGQSFTLVTSKTDGTHQAIAA